MASSTTVDRVITQASAAVRRRERRRWVTTVILLVLAIFWASPMILLLVTALRTAADFSSSGALSLPKSFTLGNFSKAWDVGDFSTAFRNSILITVVKAPLGVFLSALLAFALSKLNIPFRRVISFAVILGLTIPIFIAVVPLFTLLRSVNLIDSIWGLLPPYLGFGLPLSVLILESFFRRLPNEVIEAAHVDGAGPFRIFFQIVLPLSLPALITVLILDAVATWNELLMALILLSSPEHRTIPLGLLNFQGQFSTDFTGLSAGILIVIVPVLLVYALLQRFIIAGLTAGAVKG